MIIYEVNVTVDADIYSKFIPWLQDHIKKILSVPGFTKAVYLHEQIDAYINQNAIIIQYYVDSQKNLDNYLKNHAQYMREDAIQRFHNQFKVTRRILHIQKEIY